MRNLVLMIQNLFVDPDIAFAHTIAKEFYTDPAYFEWSREHLFGASWQFAGDTDSVKNSGDVFPFILLPELLHEPLLLTKDHTQQIRCLSNVCTHRGNLLVAQPCHVPHLQCRYHGRRFQLDGTFQFMPEFKEVKNFPAQSDHLTELPLYQWGKWLFTSLHPQIEAATVLQDMALRMQWLPLDDFHFRVDLSSEYAVDAHWALYCENYLEGFHIPFVHAGLNSMIDFGTYTTELFSHSNLQVGLAKEGELAFDLPPESPDYGKRIGAYYFWIFPNMMFNFYPWGLSVNIVKPVSIVKSVVSFFTYVWDESKLEQGAGSDLFRVEMEDEEVVEAVQMGIRSRFYEHGRYSVLREQGTHHFHRLLSASLAASLQ